MLSFAALTGTAIVHMGLWVLAETAEEVTEAKSVHGNLGEPVRVEDWEITVLGVKEATYVKGVTLTTGLRRVAKRS